jgi:hypothetical protein
VTEAAAEAERSVIDVATLVTADRRRLLESPKANAAVKLLTELGIVMEMTGQRKNRTFGYQNYIELLARSE